MKFYSEEAMKSPYWCEYLETMPREKLDELQMRRIRGLMKYAYERVPLYRDLYDRHEVNIAEIQTMEDLATKVPMVDKTDLLDYQRHNPPYGGTIVRGSEDYMSLFFRTSGTTGTPLMEPAHFKECQNSQSAVAMWAFGIRPRDSFYVAFNFGTFSGMWSGFYDAIMLGAQVIPGGGADTRGHINNIKLFQPTVLCSTPTYALRLAEAAREMGINPTDLGIKYIWTGGEPGSAVPSIREAMEGSWGATAMDVYGISELFCTTTQCYVNRNDLHLSEGTAFGIVLDEHGEVAPEGGRGEYVITSYSSVMPLINYRTHDIVHWSRKKCTCGRTWTTIKGGVMGRTDQMVNVMGTNVYPNGIQALLGHVQGLTENLEIHIDKNEKGLDTVFVKVEAVPNLAPDHYLDLRTRTEAELREKVGVRIGVEVLPPRTLPRYDVKARRVIDHRKK